MEDFEETFKKLQEANLNPIQGGGRTTKRLESPNAGITFSYKTDKPGTQEELKATVQVYKKSIQVTYTCSYMDFWTIARALEQFFPNLRSTLAYVTVTPKDALEMKQTILGLEHRIEILDQERSRVYELIFAAQSPDACDKAELTDTWDRFLDSYLTLRRETDAEIARLTNERCTQKGK